MEMCLNSEWLRYVNVYSDNLLMNILENLNCKILPLPQEIKNCKFITSGRFEGEKKRPKSYEPIALLLIRHKK